MLTIDQRKLRRSLVTATDIVVLSGCYPWRRSPIGIYLEKTEGEIPANDTHIECELVAEDETEGEASDAAKLGLYVEPYLVQWAGGQHKCWTLPGETVRHPTELWAGSTPDGFAVEAAYEAVSPPSLVMRREQRLLACIEAKVVGRHRFAHWGGYADDKWILPEYVAVQAQWQMTTKQTRHCLVPVLLGTEHRLYIVEHSDALEAELLTIGRAFWRCVEERRPPPLDGSADAWKMVRRSFAHVRQFERLPATAEQEALAKAAEAALEEAKLWTIERARLKQELAESMGDARSVEGHDWRATKTVRKAHVRGGIEVPEAPSFYFGPIKAKPGRDPNKTDEGEAA